MAQLHALMEGPHRDEAGHFTRIRSTTALAWLNALVDDLFRKNSGACIAQGARQVPLLSIKAQGLHRIKLGHHAYMEKLKPTVVVCLNASLEGLYRKNSGAGTAQGRSHFARQAHCAQRGGTRLTINAQGLHRNKRGHHQRGHHMLLLLLSIKAQGHHVIWTVVVCLNASLEGLHRKNRGAGTVSQEVEGLEGLYHKKILQGLEAGPDFVQGSFHRAIQAALACNHLWILNTSRVAASAGKLIHLCQLEPGRKV
jgi:hypothetical protein